MKELESLGILIPETHLITSRQEFSQLDRKKTYALKACYSRGSLSVYKLLPKSALFKRINPTAESPWIAQEWLYGDHYCSYSICKEGRIQAHALYPVDLVRPKTSKLLRKIGSYCFTFRPVYNEKISQWIEEVVRKTHFTGQIAFDFIQLESGEIYPIECNPRRTGGLTLFAPEDNLARALFEELAVPIEPLPNRKKQNLTTMLSYGWRSAYVCKKLPLYFKQLFTYPDLLFRLSDIRPFLSYAYLALQYFISRCCFQNEEKPNIFIQDIHYNGKTPWSNLEQSALEEEIKSNDPPLDSPN